MTDLPMDLQRVIYGHKYRMECEDEEDKWIERENRYKLNIREEYRKCEDYEPHDETDARANYIRSNIFGALLWEQGETWTMEDTHHQYVAEAYAAELEDARDEARTTPINFIF
tara:strand:- start:1680 stop:2018 length:339 start_codon:yes stop_codon:yes gene_type:complete